AARQVVPAGVTTSGGHAGDAPVHTSSGSQRSPEPVRQVVPAPTSVSPGQAAPAPVQFSATSHVPAAGRQTVLEDWKSSAGQVVLLPSHCSATSQTPADARQVAPALPAGCWQASFTPSHSSSEQGFPSLVQLVPFGCFASAGQFTPTPSQ